MKKILLSLIALSILMSFQAQAIELPVVGIKVERKIGLFAWGTVFNLKVPLQEKPFEVSYKELDLKAIVKLKFHNTLEESTGDISTIFTSKITKGNEVLSSSNELLNFNSISVGESLTKRIEMNIRRRQFIYRVTVRNTGETINSSDL